MNWLENILLRLGILERVRGAEKPAGQIDRTTQADKHKTKEPESDAARPATKVDSHKTEEQEGGSEKLTLGGSNYKILFENLDPMVTPLLREIGEVRWGKRELLYEANPDELKWHIWRSESVFLNSEYWIVQLIPAKAAHFRITCANQPIITSGISKNELEQALAKALEAGPVITNVASKVWH